MSDKSILYIDDETSLLQIMSHALEKRGYEVATASSGESGLQIFNEIKPNVVVTDIMMEGISGIEVLKQVKKERPDTVVIALTGYGTMDTSIEALRLGAYDYLLKPCDRDELAIKISKGLKQQGMERQIKDLNEQLIAANSELIKREEKLKSKTEELEKLAILDGLTNTYNRRYLDQYLDQEVKRAIRNKHELACVLLDIDCFKQYNDNYGHQAGDDGLKQIAKVLCESLHRASDIIARYGGEEFAVILPDTSLEGALKIAEALKEAVVSLNIEHAHSSVAECVTVSLGVSAFKPANGFQTRTLVEAADKALYKAKNNGRNQVSY